MFVYMYLCRPYINIYTSIDIHILYRRKHKENYNLFSRNQVGSMCVLQYVLNILCTGISTLDKDNFTLKFMILLYNRLMAINNFIFCVEIHDNNLLTRRVFVWLIVSEVTIHHQCGKYEGWHISVRGGGTLVYSLPDKLRELEHNGVWPSN